MTRQREREKKRERIREHVRQRILHHSITFDDEIDIRGAIDGS